MKKDRRDFLKTGALAASSFFIVPRHVLGKGFTAPSDKLNLAAVGAGGKGTSDIFNAYNNGKENVVALCDIDVNQCKRSIERFPKAKIYADFREMFEKQKDIDAVTVSTPDHMHGIVAMTAMQHGKHVYVQKPLTHNIYETRQLTEAARKYRLVTQMGNQGASNPGQQQMIEWYKKGLIGQVDKIDVWTDRPVWPQGKALPTSKVPLPPTISKANWDLYIGPAEYYDYNPLFHPFNWRGWWNFGTGALGDMGCHLIDPPFRVMELGYPSEVECSVGQVFEKMWNPEHNVESCPPSSYVQLKFPKNERVPNDVLMTWSDGGIRPFHPSIIPADDSIGEPGSGNGVIMHGTKGVMTCGTYGQFAKVYLNSGEKLECPKDYSTNNKNEKLPEYGHQVSWTDAIKAGFNSKEHKALTSSFDYAGPLTETVLMGNLAIRSYSEATKDEKGRKKFDGRKRLLWDGEKMKILNYEPANKYVSRNYRDGWKLI